MDAENARLAVDIQQIATEMTELQKSLKENSSFDNVVADRMEKIEEMEVCFIFLCLFLYFIAKIKRNERKYFKFGRNSAEIEG